MFSPFDEKKGSPKSHLNLSYTYIELYITYIRGPEKYILYIILYIFRQKYWSGLPFPPPGDLPNPGTEPASLAVVGNSLPLSDQAVLKT